VTLVSGSTSFVVIRRRFLQKRHQTGVELLKLTTNLQFWHCYIFLSFRDNVGIIVPYNTNKYDLECLIQLKCDFGGKSEVRMLLLSKLTACDW